MRSLILCVTLLAHFAIAGLAVAQEPVVDAEIVQVQVSPGPTAPAAPQPMPLPPMGTTTTTTPRVLTTTAAPPSLSLARAGTATRPIELPNMYGDFQGTAGLTRGTASNTELLVDGASARSSGRLPVPVIRGAYKISENEGPRPVDRAYITYNFFYDVNPPQRKRIAGLPITNVHRQTFGIEKTFLDGDASIGLRLPLLQLTGPTDLDSSTVGDLSVILKYALINEPFEPTADGTLQGGRVLSTGIVVTAPTGGAAAFTVRDPLIHPTLLQPFVGGTWTYRRAYVQGISSIAVPTDDRDTTYMFNSLQVGYQLLVDTTGSRLLSSITPIAELHVNTPFNNRDVMKFPVGATDIVSFTLGTTYGLGQRSNFNIGINVPVTGPRVYALETLLHLNVRY